MKKLTSITIRLLLAFLLVSACNNISQNEQTQATEVEKTDNNQSASLEEQGRTTVLQGQTDQILDKYHELKATLVETAPQKVRKSAKSFAELIKTINEKAVSENQVPLMVAIQKNVEKITTSDDIEAQRELFVPLTDNVYELVKAFPANETVYYAYCPMAFNDKGAYWLEKEKAIFNPYFGSKMLKCGSIKETIGREGK